VSQYLSIECFAVAAYRLCLPVVDPYAQPITAAVMADEQEHLNYGEQWLRPRFTAVADQVEACARRAVPVALGMLEQLRGDLATIGTDERAARRLVNRLASRALAQTRLACRALGSNVRASASSQAEAMGAAPVHPPNRSCNQVSTAALVVTTASSPQPCPRLRAAT